MESPLKRLLIVNRGEIAIRIARAAAELGIETVAIHASDDEHALHLRHADRKVALQGRGVAAYMDIESLTRIAVDEGCDAVHPGYGFLSESARFANALDAEGVRFVGPTAAQLELFGDKLRARKLAQEHGVPLVRGTTGALTIDDARAFFDSLPAGQAMLIKAVAGGGGRGMRVVKSQAEIEGAFVRCQSEARSGFGNGALYIEQLIEGARHVEVQVVGDGTGAVTHLWERECTLQRRHQKLVELAPSPNLSEPVRDGLVQAALTMARAQQFSSLGTFEFLVRDAQAGGDPFYFIECNPRLQVEHTVTEAVTGVDLVTTQLRLAAGETLQDVGLDPALPVRPRGQAIQVRVNMESAAPDGQILPSGGRLTVFDPPGGPGVRVDTFGYAGYETVAGYDALLAKVIVWSPGGYQGALAKAGRALAEFRIEGVETNVGFLRRLLSHPDVRANRIHTRFIEEKMDEVRARPAGPDRFFAPSGQSPEEQLAAEVGPSGTVGIPTPMPGVVVSLPVAVGAAVTASTEIAVIEAMKMQFMVTAGQRGVLQALAVREGDMLKPGQVVAWLRPDEGAEVEEHDHIEADPNEIRSDLAELLARKHALTDEGRPDAVAKRHSRNGRMARENIDDLCDAGSFTEYGGLVLAMQRGRRTPDELQRLSPADGLVTGLGDVNGALFDESRVDFHRELTRLAS